MAALMQHELKSVIDDFIENPENSPNSLSLIVNDIKTGKVKLLDLVGALGPALTNSNVSVRKRGSELLSDVVCKLDVGTLNENEVMVLTEFFTARLADHHSLTAVILRGLAPLCTSRLLPAPTIEQMLRAMFKDVTVQTLPQADRLVVYQILEYFIDNRLTDIQTMDSDFVLGVIQTVDGEKDPRNLLGVFKIVRTVAQSFNLSVLAEELFEVVACYFPVDFTPPPDYGFTITREQLADGLAGCFTASPAFAEFCLTLLLEKLESSIVSAKLDSLDVLKQVCPIYDRKPLEDFSGGLWSLIRNEVFSSGNTRTETPALEALTALVKALTVNCDMASGDTPVSIIDTIFQDCRRYLEEPDQLIFHQSGKLLSAAALASISSCGRIIQLTVPLFISEFNLHIQPSRRQNLLDFFLILLKSTQSFSSSFNDSPLLPYKSEIYGLFVSLLSNANSLLRSRGVLGLVGMLAAHPTLLTKERLQISEHLLSLILNDDDSNVREECINAASYMSSKFPEVVAHSIQPQLVSCLQNGNGRDKPHITDVYLLTCIARISASVQSIKSNIPIFIQYLQRSLNTKSTVGVEEAVQCCQCIDQIVLNQLSGNSVDPVALHDLLSYFLSELLPRCQELLVGACAPSNDHLVLREERVVGGVCSVVRRVVQAASAVEYHDVTAAYLTSIINLFLDGDLTCLSATVEQSLSFHPLQADASREQTNLVDYLTANVCSVPNQDIVPRFDELTTRLFEFCKSCSDVNAVISAAKCLSALVNKDKNDERVVRNVEQYQKDLINLIDKTTDQSPDGQAIRAAVVWVWLTKALVLRGHRLQATFTTRMVEMLDRADVAAVIAEGFEVVMKEREDVMSGESHAHLTLLYRQRFFTLAIQPLLAAYSSQTVNQSQRSYYMKAVSCVIPYIPKQVLLSELPKLMPLLMQSLSSDDSSLWICTVDTLADLMLNNAEALTSHIDDLVPRLLTLAAYKPSMKVRLAALNCIDRLTSLVEHRLLPHQVTVTRSLGVLLDDHKRLVRQAAARAREKWFLLGDVTD